MCDKLKESLASLEVTMSNNKCKGVMDFDPVEDAINEMMEYHQATCGDKYGEAIMDTMSLIMNDEHGKSINIFNAFKYLSRYITSGYEKSDNRKDVIKAIHYLLFELARTEGQTETIVTDINGLWSFDNHHNWIFNPTIDGEITLSPLSDSNGSVGMDASGSEPAVMPPRESITHIHNG